MRKTDDPRDPKHAERLLGQLRQHADKNPLIAHKLHRLADDLEQLLPTGQENWSFPVRAFLATLQGGAGGIIVGAIISKII